MALRVWLAIVVAALAILVVAPLQLSAQEHESGEPVGEHEGTTEEHREAHEEGRHLHKHHLAVIISATEAVEEHGDEHDGNGHSEGSSDSKDDPDFTIGFDYERRFTQLFGFGGMIDWVAEGRREFLFGPIGVLHPFKGSKFWVAPLAERVRETGDWSLVVRVGTGWDIPIGKSGKYSIAPNINYDISDEHQLWVVGVAIGKGF